MAKKKEWCDLTECEQRAEVKAAWAKNRYEAVYIDMEQEMDMGDLDLCNMFIDRNIRKKA